MSPGFVRDAVSRAVTEAKRDPLRAGVLIIEWAHATVTTQAIAAALLDELQREVGRPPMLPELEIELEQTFREAEGDAATETALLHERLDARENPGFAVMAEKHYRQQVTRPLARMVLDEINRLDEEDYRREEARRAARRKPRTRRR